jgi:hypothetical protein
MLGMVHDHKAQATHCAEEPTWTGRCPIWPARVAGTELPGPPRGPDGLREFGRRRSS